MSISERWARRLLDQSTGCIGAPAMNNQPRFGFAIEYVKDLQVSRRFYTAMLGLEVEREHDGFVQFRNFTITNERHPNGKQVELYWLVDDAEAASKELAERTGIRFPVNETPFGKVFQIEDPNGRPCFVLELAKDRRDE